MTPEPEARGSTAPPDPTVAWNKVQLYVDRLFDALEDLEEGGGVIAAARLGCWKGKKLEKAAASLVATMEAIEATLAGLRSGRAKVGRRRRPVRPAPSGTSPPSPTPCVAPPPPPPTAEGAVAPCNSGGGGSLRRKVREMARPPEK